MALTAVDRALLNRCLKHEPGAWREFVDRFLGMMYHTVHYTAHLHSARLRPEDNEDVVADILLQIVANDYAVLRQFRGNSSLGTYLAVVARRICVHEITRRLGGPGQVADGQRPEPEAPAGSAGLESLEEVQQLLGKLPPKERDVVRLYYLEGRTYEEISAEVEIPVNSIGPILSRARKRLRGESHGDDTPKRADTARN